MYDKDKTGKKYTVSGKYKKTPKQLGYEKLLDINELI